MKPFLMMLIALAPLACESEGTQSTDVPTDGNDTSTAAVEVVINELCAACVPDWVELYNPGTTDAMLGGYFISDDPDAPTRAVLPASTVVPAGGYLVLDIDRDAFPGFGLGGEESFALRTPDETLVDEVAWLEGDAPAGTTWGRIPDGTGGFKTLNAPTPGAANQDNSGGSVCGDATIEGDESCDDGNRIEDDGCDAACVSEVGWDCAGQPSLCVTTCGDGIAAGREQCDNPNDTRCDTTTCTLETVAAEVAINEIVARPFGASDADHIELYHFGSAPLDVSGWTVTDSNTVENRFVFPAGSQLLPESYFELTRDIDFFFNLSDADEVRLYRGDVADENLVDMVRWVPGDAPEGGSYGRFPNGTGDFKTLSRYTQGAANVE